MEITQNAGGGFCIPVRKLLILGLKPSTLDQQKLFALSHGVLSYIQQVSIYVMTELERKNHPVWELYDLHRNAAYYVWLYRCLTDRYTTAIFWLDIMGAVFAGSSAIAGLSLWKTTAGHQIWIAGSACAAVSAGLKPTLHLTDKLKHYQDLYSRYVTFEASCANLGTQIKNAKRYNATHVTTLIKLRERASALKSSAPPVQLTDSFVRSIQSKINHLMPPENFYIPET